MFEISYPKTLLKERIYPTHCMFLCKTFYIGSIIFLYSCFVFRKRRQAIIWTNAGILLIWPSGTNFNENLIGIETFSFKKMHLKMSSAKWRPFCLGLNMLTPFRLHSLSWPCQDSLVFVSGHLQSGLYSILGRCAFDNEKDWFYHRTEILVYS